MNKWLTCFFCLSIIISCSTEEESEVPSLVGPGDGLYILCENNVSFYAPLNNSSNDPIDITSQIGLSFNNPKKIRITSNKMYVTSNKIDIVNLNNLFIENSISGNSFNGLINPTDCQYLDYGRIFVTDRGDSKVKVIDLTTNDITTIIETGDSTKPNFIVNKFWRAYVLNSGGQTSSKKDTTIVSIDYKDGLVPIADFSGEVIVGDNPSSAVFSDQLKVLCKGIYNINNNSNDSESSFYVVNPWDHYVISSVNLNNVYNAQSLVENYNGSALFFTASDGIYRIYYPSLSYSKILDLQTNKIALNVEKYYDTDTTFVYAEMIYSNDLNNPNLIYKYNPFLDSITDTITFSSNVIDFIFRGN